MCAAVCHCIQGEQFSPSRDRGGAHGPCVRRRVLGGAHHAGGPACAGWHHPDRHRRHRTAVARGGGRDRVFDRSWRQSDRRVARPQPVRERRAAQHHRRWGVGRQRRAPSPATMSASSSSSRTSWRAISRCEIDLDAIKQSLEAYDQRALTAEDRDRPQDFGALDHQLRPERRAGGDHPGRRRCELQPDRRAALGEIRQHR